MGKKGPKRFTAQKRIETMLARAKLNSSGCLIWQGSTNFAYGKVSYQRKIWSAHRLIWHLTNGPIPEGKFVCHSCDNKLCINLLHLFLGSPRENSHDMIKKGRGRNPANKLNSYGFHGIYKKVNRFYARVRHLGEGYYSKGFLTAKEAALEYDKMAKKIMGKPRVLNFPKEATP